MMRRTAMAALLISFFLMLFGCKDKSEQSKNADDDAFISDGECTVPFYCEDEKVYMQTRALPDTEGVDCAKSAEFYNFCIYSENESAEYKKSVEFATNQCVKLGSFDYSQFATCDDMWAKIKELTSEWVDTSTLTQCQPGYCSHPQSGESDVDIWYYYACRDVCQAMMARCPGQIEAYVERVSPNSETLDSCAWDCGATHFEPETVKKLQEMADGLPCADAVCIISEYYCLKENEPDGDDDAEPIVIEATDYEVTP